MKILFDTPKFDCYQTFFVEKAYELLYRQTIDSYRARVMNPRLILIELLLVTDGRVKGKIKDFKTVESCRDEAVFLLKSDETLIFNTLSKDYFVKLIQSIEEKESSENKDKFSKIKIAIRTILDENQDYAQKLIAKISFYLKNPIEPKHDEFMTFRLIDGLTTSFITELIALGYHKSFLFKRLNQLFVINNNTFEEAFEELNKMIVTEEKKYHIWFKLNSTKEVSQSLANFLQFAVYENIETVLHEKTVSNIRISQFTRPSNAVRFLLVEQQALDYYSALYTAKNLITENLDILNLGFGHINSRLSDSALVVDVTFPEKAQLQSIKPVLDGSYAYGKVLFNDLYIKIPRILDKQNIASEAKEKLKSAFRYLRLGNEGMEVEHQFISYWVGLEYLFTNHSDSAFTRIKHLLPILQALSYVKRNALDLHQRVAPIVTKLTLQNYNTDNLNCLLQNEFYEEIKHKVFPTSPLLSYRAWKLQRRFFPKKGETNEALEKYIEDHIKGLKQHLVRIYRVRNEIVHEAQYNTNNENLTANLKYYLVFSLSIIIDYLDNYKGHELASLDDFFQLQEAKYENFKYLKYPLNKILEIGDNYAILGG
jgi:hypothetical protein